MKRLYFIILLVSSIGHAQIPSDYYDSASGLSGYTLKTELKNIVTNGHDLTKTYNDLYTGYLTTDTDIYFEMDGTVLDMYSEDPDNFDPYNYTHNVRLCGEYNSENDCYNREHIFPQGFFNSGEPMRNDIHQVVPSDGYVNGRRANYPFGEVNDPATWVSLNGSKVGTSNTPGYTNNVFEPIDAFKGDIARMLFYFAVRYEDESKDGSWDDHDSVPENTLDASKNQFYETWYINLLYKWHSEDPVSAREEDRNEAAYNYQGNANPFIDHPEYALSIWGNVLSTNNEDLLKTISIYPNPLRGDYLNIKTTESLQMYIYDILGKLIIRGKVDSNSNRINVASLRKGIYLVKLKSENGELTKKLIKQ